jgi:glycosyltransferase involved in cell wall biosynthesis
VKLVMLSSGDRVPSSRFRMLPYVRHFRNNGHRCTVASSVPQKYEWFPAIGFRLSQRLKRLIRYLHWYQSRMRGDEIVIIDREVFDSPCTKLEECFRRTTSRFVLDLDDAVFLRYPEKFEKLTRLADLIVCGNSYIEEWAKERNPNTIVIPTCVDTSVYVPAAKRAATGFVIGWIGTPSNVPMLNTIIPALQILKSKHDFILRIVTALDELPAELRDSGLPIEIVRWNAKLDVRELQQFDVGVMPLTDDDWNRHKCGFKLLQYMSVGIPAVASPVGVNRTIINHGENGFLAETTNDWTASLASQASDRNLRNSIGNAARETVTARYSIEANFPRYEAALLNLLSRTDWSLTGRKSRE